jgi:hypothetical protein
MSSNQASSTEFRGIGLHFVNTLRFFVLLIPGLFLTLPLMGSDQAQAPSSGIGTTSESSFGSIRVISPVTQNNMDAVLSGLRQRDSLRELTAAESNALTSAVPPGTYFYAYGFQLANSEESSDFIVSRKRGADWRHFELHKQANDEIVLLGFTTSKDAGKFEYYSKRYGPTPNLLAQPVDDFNVLMIVPLKLIDKMVSQEVKIGSGGATALDAALLPKR